MILPVPPTNADFQEYFPTEVIALLKDEICISEKPLPIWKAHRDALRFIFPLPKQNEFDRLVKQWHEERGASSSISEIAMSPSYQKIIGLGKEVGLPLVLKKLAEEGDEPDFWFWALSVWDIENPPVIPDDVRGNFKKMAKVWIDWGKQKNTYVHWS